MLGGNMMSTHLWDTGRVLEVEKMSSHAVLSQPVLVSVVVPCCGQLEFTRLCIPSLLRYSRRPYELVLVDVGSLDGTTEYLAGVQVAAPLRVEVIQVGEESNLPTACDEGISRAHGRYVAILSNDTIVTPDWLNQLTALADSAPSIGVVGPMSNYASPAQCIGSVPYSIDPQRESQLLTGPDESHRNYRVLERFAEQWRNEHRGQWFDAETLDAFCLLFKREVLERVGPLAELSNLSDEPLGLRLLDEVALSRKVRQVGYRLAGCRDLFIHYFGSRAPAKVHR
jgi:GT2 family glycosyltransferase